MRILELKETEVRGNRLFPIEAYPVTLQHPRYRMPLHWHVEFEIIKVVRGSFHYNIGQESGTARPGDLLFVGSGVLHGGMPEDSEYRCIVFDSSLIAREESSADGKALSSFSKGEYAIKAQLPSHDTQLSSIFDLLFQLLTEKPDGYELQAQGMLYLFFGWVLQKKYYEKGGDGGGKKWVAQLKEAIALIENEYASPLTLEELAQAAGMSRKYFCHFFKQMTRYSPIEYLNRHRVEVACYKLMAGLSNVTDIAYECGFNDLSYFIRMFKRIVGMTPKQYALLRQAMAP